MTTDPIPNLPLLRRILRHIDAHPEEWVQRHWAKKTACGTAYCIAGHAINMEMSSDVFCWIERDYGMRVSYTCLTTFEPVSIEPISIVAQRLLGLTDIERRSLFASLNSRGDIQFIAHMIAERAGEPLWPPEPSTTTEPIHEQRDAGLLQQDPDPEILGTTTLG